MFTDDGLIVCLYVSYRKKLFHAYVIDQIPTILIVYVTIFRTTHRQRKYGFQQKYYYKTVRFKLKSNTVEWIYPFSVLS